MSTGANIYYDKMTHFRVRPKMILIRFRTLPQWQLTYLLHDTLYSNTMGVLKLWICTSMHIGSVRHVHWFTTLWCLTNDDIFSDSWPRALLKGPKRSFVVLLVVGVETWVKNVLNGTNVFVRTKKVPYGTLNARGNKKRS